MTASALHTSLTQLRNELLRLGWKIATAESLTAGQVASTIASQSGSSAYLRGGVVVYDIDMKVNILGVSRELAAATDCVDPMVAKQMAFGIQRLTGCEVVIATTGYAEDSSAVRAHAYVHLIAGAYHKGITVHRDDDMDLRNTMRMKVVEQAFIALVSMLKTQ